MLVATIAILVLVTTLTTMNAGTTDYSEYTKIANSYVKVQETPIELYNLNNDIVALYYKAVNTGYVIVNIKDKIVPEFSDESNNKLISESGKNYYNGPTEVNDEIDKTINEQKEIYGTEEYIKNEKATTENKSLIKNASPAIGDDFETEANNTKKIKGTMPNYSYNPNGICGTTAAAMMLQYLDNNISDKYVPKNLEGDEIKFIKKLEEYIHAKTLAHDVLSGMCNFEDKYGVKNMQASVEKSNLGNVVGCVNDGMPFELSLRKDPKYGYHWVTAYGYKYNSKSEYAIVNDGHGSTGVNVNLKYSDVFIRPWK
jgi:hypothetical protein